MSQWDIVFLVSFVVGSGVMLIVLAVNDWLQERKHKRIMREKGLIR